MPALKCTGSISTIATLRKLIEPVPYSEAEHTLFAFRDRRYCSEPISKKLTCFSHAVGSYLFWFWFLNGVARELIE